MTFSRLNAALALTLSAFSLSLVAQQPEASLHKPPTAAAPAESIQLDVVVENKSGQPITNLQQQDFTVLDDKTPRPITSFRVETPRQVPVEVILYLDAVNTPYELLAQVRKGTDQYFKENEGALAHPTTFAFLTDDGAQFNKRFSSNGMKLSDDLEHDQVGIRQINRSTQWSAIDRLNIGIRAIHQLVDFSSRLPGRKIIIFISPGFPLLSGPGVQLTKNQHRQIFGDAIYLTNQLRRNDVTLYNIDPIGVSQSMFSATYYQTYLKGLTQVDDAQFAYLSPQVLSPQSGGLTITSSNDIPDMIQRCLRDTESWYSISFSPLPSEKHDDFHSINVRVDQAHAVVRTRDGYYANPSPVIIK